MRDLDSPRDKTQSESFDSSLNYADWQSISGNLFADMRLQRTEERNKSTDVHPGSRQNGINDKNDGQYLVMSRIDISEYHYHPSETDRQPSGPKSEKLQNGNIQTTNPDGSSVVSTADGKVVKTKDVEGVTREFREGKNGLEVYEFGQWRKPGNSATVSSDGTFTWGDKNKVVSHKLDGTRIFMNLENGWVDERNEIKGTRKTSKPDGEVWEDKRDASGNILSTITMDGKLVTESTRFASPISLEVNTANGTQALHEVNSVERKYNPKTGQLERESYDLRYQPGSSFDDGPGTPSPELAAAGGGKLSFNPSQVHNTIHNGKTVETEYKLRGENVTFQNESGNSTFEGVTAVKTSRRGDGTAVAALIGERDGASERPILDYKLLTPTQSGADRENSEVTKNPAPTSGTKEMYDLIAQLGDMKFDVRTNAHKALETMAGENPSGTLIAALRETMSGSKDSEMRRQAQEIMAKVLINTPVPESLFEHKDKLEKDFFKAVEQYQRDGKVTPELRDRFKNLISDSDKQLPDRISQWELASRADLLRSDIENRASGGRALSQKDDKTLQRELSGVAFALSHCAYARLEFAHALSQSKDLTDKQASVVLLGEAMNKFPEIARDEVFNSVANQSGGMTNPDFVEAWNYARTR